MCNIFELLPSRASKDEGNCSTSVNICANQFGLHVAVFIVLMVSVEIFVVFLNDNQTNVNTSIINDWKHIRSTNLTKKTFATMNEENEIEAIDTSFNNTLSNYVYTTKVDLIKSNKIGNINCRQNLPFYVEIGCHHKQGVDLTRFIVDSICKFCQIPFNIHRFKQSFLNENATYFNQKPHWPLNFLNVKKLYNMSHTTTFSYDNNGSNYYMREDNNHDIVLLHFVRDALGTIISGYNYHGRCASDVMLHCSIFSHDCSFIHRATSWANARNNIAFNIFEEFNETKHFSVKFRRENVVEIKNIRYCFERNGLINDRLMSIIKSNGLTICQLLNMNKRDSKNNFTLTERIYFEFVRFVNCQFDEVYQSYKLISMIENDNDKIDELKKFKGLKGFTFKMQQYTKSKEYFDQFVDRLANDALGLKFYFDKQLQNVSSQYYNYTLLLNLMRKHDINRKSTKTLQNDKHILHRRNNINTDYQIDLLLRYKHQVDQNTIIDVCSIIKKMTLLLDDSWQYDDYC